MRRVAVWIAAVGPLGFAPIAPGTFGSAAGILIYWLTRHWSTPAQLGLIVVVTVVGTWAATEAAKHFGREDPGQVVIDEVAGQLVTLAFTGAGVTAALAGFFIFRILDIIKPYPANRFERLHGGVGIMADDLMAGVYGCVLLQLLMHYFPGVIA
ncbi:MAG: phosphatidylglycerophosphatase A [Acidobacteriota bacterium]